MIQKKADADAENSYSPPSAHKWVYSLSSAERESQWFSILFYPRSYPRRDSLVPILHPPRHQSSFCRLLPSLQSPVLIPICGVVLEGKAAPRSGGCGRQRQRKRHQQTQLDRCSSPGSASLATNLPPVGSRCDGSYFSSILAGYLFWLDPPMECGMVQRKFVYCTVDLVSLFELDFNHSTNSCTMNIAAQHVAICGLWGTDSFRIHPLYWHIWCICGNRVGG
jgi:hypothetical protein